MPDLNVINNQGVLVKSLDSKQVIVFRSRSQWTATRKEIKPIERAAVTRVFMCRKVS